MTLTVNPDLSDGVRHVRFTPDPDDTKAGELFTLETGSNIVCNATGSGPITYLWLSVKSEGPGSVIGQELLITPEMVGNRNEYTCIARNAKGEMERNVEFYGTFFWRHNGRDSVSNHRYLDCLLKCLFRRKPKKTSKLHVTGLCEGGGGIHRWPVDSPHKGPVTRKMFLYTWWRH